MKRFIISFLLVFSAISTFAQRTSQGTFFATIETGTTFSSFGLVGIEGGLYSRNGFWDVRIGSMMISRRTVGSMAENTGRLSAMRADLEGSYMFRLYSNKNRIFNLYAGGGAFIGAEMIDPFGTFSRTAVLPFSTSTVFIYGISPRADAEFFFLPMTVPNLALTGIIRTPLCFNSQMQMFHAELLVGLKYNF
ncbi:MAG: conjugal transfer protein TraO [Spirochaetales bacterium]|nr:conjugal transfer protein TraO [Candidatus Physcosoma equi]